MRNIALLLLALTAASAAHAQLNKCVTAAGKVEYRDSPCDDARQHRPVGGAVSELPAMSAQDIGRAKALMAEEQRGPRATVIGPPPGRPTEQDIRNMETSASSVLQGRKEREFLQGEVRRAKAAAAGDGTYTDNDLATLKERQADQNRMRAEEREAARREAESVHLRAGGRSQTIDVLQQRQAEEERARARRAAAAAAANGPAVISNCDAAGCWDTRGTRYNKAAGKGNYFRQDGKACVMAAGNLQCH